MYKRLSREWMKREKNVTKLFESLASNDEENEKSLWNLKPIFFLFILTQVAKVSLGKMICKTSENVYFHYIES